MQLAEQLAQNVESTLAAARSPSLALEFEAGVKRAEGYARAPVAPETRATIDRAVDRLVGRTPAPGPVCFSSRLDRRLWFHAIAFWGNLWLRKVYCVSQTRKRYPRELRKLTAYS